MAERGTTSALRDSGVEKTSLSLPGLSLAEHNEFRFTGYRRHAEAGVQPVGWPGTVGEVVGADPVICRLRPGEWLRMASEVEDEAPSVPGLVALDRSDGLAVLRVSGNRAPWLLAQLCGLDVFALAASRVPCCAQTRLGDVRTLVLTRPALANGEARFDLVVERSLVRHLWERLLAAAPHAVRLADTLPG